jgi:hypothetical protein
MKTTLVLAAALAVALSTLCSPGVGGQEKKSDDKDKASIWMKKKLEFSQNILSGLTKGDFESVTKNSAEMSILNYLERWSRADQPRYKQQIAAFDMANKELTKQAAAKNIDGAVLAFNQLTISCVQCHKIVRDASK